MNAEEGLFSGVPPLSNRTASERTRRLVHLLFGAGALLIPVIGWGWCVAVSVLALGYNAVVAPRLGLDRAYRRSGEGHMSGLLTYPLAVLLLLLVFPPAVAAGSWIVLAVLDPVAATVGERVGKPHVPWNRRKSLAGSAAGLLLGAAACFAILRYMDAADPLPAALAAAAAGALAESLPLPIEDNLPLAAASGIVLQLCLT